MAWWIVTAIYRIDNTNLEEYVRLQDMNVSARDTCSLELTWMWQLLDESRPLWGTERSEIVACCETGCSLIALLAGPRLCAVFLARAARPHFSHTILSPAAGSPQLRLCWVVKHQLGLWKITFALSVWEHAVLPTFPRRLCMDTLLSEGKTLHVRSR